MKEYFKEPLVIGLSIAGLLCAIGTFYLVSIDQIELAGELAASAITAVVFVIGGYFIK